jgi:hypothetical protein
MGLRTRLLMQLAQQLMALAEAHQVAVVYTNQVRAPAAWLLMVRALLSLQPLRLRVPGVRLPSLQPPPPHHHHHRHHHHQPPAHCCCRR